MSVKGFSKFFSKRTEFMKASEIRELLKVVESRDVISLAGGLPDPSTFPKEELAEIASYIIREYGEMALQYGTTQGARILREALCHFMARVMILCKPENILITTGSQQALDIISRTLIDPGDLVVVELPTYLAAINVFKLSQPEFIGIPIDEDGMRTDVLEEKLKQIYSEGRRVKFVYTVPTAQNPSGVTMSNDRRKHLLELAERYDFLIIEDDPYSHFLFEPVSFKHLKAMDTSGRVVYISTISKILSPGLRIGWIIAHEELVGVFERAKQNLDLHTPTLNQYIVAEAIRRRVIERYLPRVRELYRKKKNIMLEALEEYFPEGSRWTKPVGGLFIFAYLPEGIDTKALLPKAIEHGVIYVPGKSFFVDGSGANTMRLNFSFPPPSKIVEGIRRLGNLLKSELKK